MATAIWSLENVYKKINKKYREICFFCGFSLFFSRKNAPNSRQTPQIREPACDYRPFYSWVWFAGATLVIF